MKWRDEFTESELLYSKVTEIRLREIMSRHTVFGKPEVDRNTYGEFLFVMVKIADEYVTFFGLGINDGSGRLKRDFEFFESSASFGYTEKEYNNALAIQAVIDRRREVETWDLPKRTTRNAVYEMLAQDHDEDAAIIEMEDNEGLFDLDEE